ncbi:MAG: YifB family Mg chelatase-like AAA ATPase [Thermodesulfobacteria bacterium]|nr:YifB family Mg chelatase-like AAA ATPase [Thermodesulfobacteriota bacterium]
MFTKVFSFSVLGIEAFQVEIEVDFSKGLPGVIIVGLPDSSVKESKERVRAAIKNSGFRFPSKKVVINLAPADLKKEGSQFDLGIALGILAATEIIDTSSLQDKVFLGELSLDGSIKSVKGVLPALLKAKDLGFKQAIIPADNLKESSLVKDFTVLGAGHLRDVIEFLRGEKELEKPPEFLDIDLEDYELDFADVLGQELAKRAIEIAAAGGHNLLMIGPPGSGKTMLAQRIPSVLPPLTYEEALETTKIYSVAGLLTPEKPFISARPFRNPHFGISEAGLIGGGTHPRPGEISLAHNGVLFLDEFPEFRRDVIEALRQPLEDGKVTITRASFTVTYPARFMLICAMNPCRCGYYGHPKRECKCSPGELRKYRTKISGPIIDRIDIHIEVPAVEYKELLGKDNIKSTDSKSIRERVIKARERQFKRYGTPNKLNSNLSSREIKKFCKMESGAEEFLEKIADRFGFSARSLYKIIKIAKTIADLEDCEIILRGHISEAVQYRVLERSLWEEWT